MNIGIQKGTPRDFVLSKTMTELTVWGMVWGYGAASGVHVFCLSFKRRGRGAMAERLTASPVMQLSRSRTPLFSFGVFREATLFLPSQCDWAITLIMLMAALSS